MFNKRGQVAIFIIIAVLIIAAFAIYLTINREAEGTTGDVSSDPVYIFVGGCIEDSLKEVVYSVGQSGGYASTPMYSTVDEIPYYYYDQKNIMPSLERIEREISEYTAERLYFCTNNFLDFPEYNIIQGEINIETEIKDNEIVIDVEYPLTIEKEGSKSRLKNWENIKISSRLKAMYLASVKIIQDQLGREGICITCILDVSLQNDLTIDFIDYGEDTKIFYIKDEKIGLNEEPYEFVFANKYPLQE